MEKKQSITPSSSERSGDVVFVEDDAALGRQITRKLDLHILPWIFVLWTLAFIDRSNIGNAKLDGLIDDLTLTGNRYNVALCAFYILYIVFEIPSNWLLTYVGGGRYLPLLAIGWGIVSTCIGFVESYAGLIVCRMLLGLFEGGMFGGISLYLSMFYKRHELMWRLGIFYSGVPLAGAFGGLLALGLSEVQVGQYKRWPWIFFVEGALTVVVAAVAFFFLPDTPGSAKFLNEEEQVTAMQRLHFDLRGAQNEERIEEARFDWYQVRHAILNVNTILMSLIEFLLIIPIYSFSLFLPTIVKSLGYSRVKAQLYTVPPNFLAFLTVIASAWISDRIKMRGPVVAAGFLIAATGYIMQLSSDRDNVKYAGTFFVAAGAFPCSPLMAAWLANNLAPHTTKATGLGFLIAFGNCGAFVATFSYLAKDGPEYTEGHAINLGAIGVVFLLTVSTMAYIWREDTARRDGKRNYRLQETRSHQLGYRHPDFRYTM